MGDGWWVGGSITNISYHCNMFSQQAYFYELSVSMSKCDDGCSSTYSCPFLYTQYSALQFLQHFPSRDLIDPTQSSMQFDMLLSIVANHMLLMKPIKKEGIKARASNCYSRGMWTNLAAGGKTSPLCIFVETARILVLWEREKILCISGPKEGKSHALLPRGFPGAHFQGGEAAYRPVLEDSRTPKKSQLQICHICPSTNSVQWDLMLHSGIKFLYKNPSSHKLPV